ncbi:hypothetical protein HMPREF9103_01353 [Lentilactobacillus parafarraginis F0439]|uniref:Uncharacterized protein n=1 Tax=Lentilactobacillus parafarraginis F0439 TaxID=797515 RepID=G9ZNP9_9LACO|nr:hypothetical protein [Lentilactobacillus parafarraginis]EHL98797.1 hypothetical protein HMPREF9103_01353 [Lentilactobacillus parafarraginis F0439]
MIEYQSQPFYKSSWSSDQLKCMRGIRWYRYEHHFAELNDDDILDARQFYYRLSYLTDEERELLKAHYYSERKLLTDVPKDSLVAARYGIDEKTYRHRRAAIKAKLKAYRATPKEKGMIDRKEVWERFKAMYGELIKQSFSFHI